MKLFVDEGYLVFVVTNQSGIGRGYYTQEDFNTLTQWMLRQFEEKEIHVEQVYHCPHSPEAQCSCRKPATGMIERALETYAIDLNHSWLVGDKQSDIDLAVNAGIGSSVFIGEASVAHATVHFDTVIEANQYFQENTGKIREIKALKG